MSKNVDSVIQLLSAMHESEKESKKNSIDDFLKNSAVLLDNKTPKNNGEKK